MAESEADDVGPTEDVVHALMETLVDPRLPYMVSSSNVPPSMEDQKSVAKQMHAVVLLYNYYHRKQKPEIEFIDFASFCELALSLRLSLTGFVKMRNGKELSADVSENGLLVTEKAIKDACDIALALDASKDFPTIEGCPISKVAALVIDSKRENCLLQFGAVIEGVWSLIEKDIDECNNIDLADEKVGTKRKSSGRDSKFLQIAFDAVKDVTGIDRVDVEVLETHVTYSLSKEKSAAQFYMMRYRKLFATNQIVPLKFLVESLRGPIAKKYNEWRTTDLVEYHRMLPYMGFISSWLSRKDSCLPSSNDCNARSATKSGEKESTQSRIAASPHSENRKFLATKGSSHNTATDENVSKKLKKTSEAAESVKDKRVTNSLFDDEDYEYLKGSLFSTSNGMRSTSDVTKTRPQSEDANKKLNSKIVVYNQRRENISSAQHEDSVNSKVDAPGLSKPNGTLCRDKKMNAKNGDMNISSDPNGVAVTENPIVPFEALDNIETKKNKQDSEDVRNALALLYAKRQELCPQFCTLGDTIAVCEDYIQRIRDGGEIDLARQCIKSILSGNDDLLPKNEIQVVDKSHKAQSEMQTGFSDIFLLGKSSCQDLEIICVKNNWRVPRYSVEPSDGKFVSNVAVGNKNFELCSKGDFECSPIEARESAASKMICQIMGTSNQR